MWSDKEFLERVARRAKVIGKSKRQVCIDAGLALDTLEKIPALGRRIDTLQKVSRALDWSLAETMGHVVIDRVTPELLGPAFEIANKALRDVQHDDDKTALIEITARVYNLLADRRRDNLPIDENVTGSLIAYIASEAKKNQ